MSAAELLEQIVRQLESDPGLRARVRTVLALAPEPKPEVVYMSIAQFAAHTGFSRRSVAGWLADGLPTIGKGRGVRVEVERAMEWLRSDRKTVADRAAERAAIAARRSPLRRVK